MVQRTMGDEIMGRRGGTKRHHHHQGDLALTMEYNMHRLLWPLLGGLLASQAAALDIGAMTLAMVPEQEFITRTLTNNSASPKLYDIAGYTQNGKISDPTVRTKTQCHFPSGGRTPTVPGELLFAPGASPCTPDMPRTSSSTTRGPPMTMSVLPHHLHRVTGSPGG